jgi:hypothetical protein
MNRNELIEEIQNIPDDNAVEIYILSQPNIVNDSYELDIYKARCHGNLGESIINLFYPVIEKKLVEKDYDLINYDPSINPDRKVVWKQGSNTVPFFNHVDSVINEEHDIEWYDSNNLAYDDIWAYWIKIYGNGKVFYIIKKVTPSKVIKTGGVLALIYDHDILKKLENDVLTMDGNLDALYCQDLLVFENKLHFENALLYKEVKQSIAEQTLDEIGEIGFVENFDQLKDFLNKLNKIKEKPYFRNLTFNDCKRIIQEYEVGIDIDDENNKFNVGTKSQAKHFIKVLNDDFLKSEMTNIKYSANSKEDL